MMKLKKTPILLCLLASLWLSSCGPDDPDDPSNYHLEKGVFVFIIIKVRLY